MRCWSAVPVCLIWLDGEPVVSVVQCTAASMPTVYMRDRSRSHPTIGRFHGVDEARRDAGSSLRKSRKTMSYAEMSTDTSGAGMSGADNARSGSIAHQIGAGFDQTWAGVDQTWAGVDQIWARFDQLWGVLDQSWGISTILGGLFDPPWGDFFGESDQFRPNSGCLTELEVDSNKFGHA